MHMVSEGASGEPQSGRPTKGHVAWRRFGESFLGDAVCELSGRHCTIFFGLRLEHDLCDLSLVIFIQGVVGFFVYLGLILYDMS